MRNNKALLAVILVVMAAGCASFGPFGTADFEPTLRRDLPAIEGKLMYQSPATLLYGIDGYGFSDNVLVRSPILAQERYVLGEGIVVLTERKIYFVKWFREKYQQHWELDYSKIVSLEIRSFGAGRRLVMKLDGAPQVTSLDIAADGGQMIDAQRTVAVCQVIAQRSGKGCKTPDS
jgi:hypothetical protein